MHILLARYFRTFRNWMSIVYKYDYELMTWEKSTRQKWCISSVWGFRPHLGTRVDSCIGRQLHWDVLRHSGALSSSHFSSILDYDKYLIGSRHSRIIWSHRQTPREGTAKINYKCMCLFLCLCTVLTCFCAFYHLHWMWSQSQFVVKRRLLLLLMSAQSCVTTENVTVWGCCQIVLVYVVNMLFIHTYFKPGVQCGADLLLRPPRSMQPFLKHCLMPYLFFSLGLLLIWRSAVCLCVPIFPSLLWENLLVSP